uniref:Uncharacterized protein n=1 Tax=Neobodo designis TaxID=312471 RepID=A0A7S1Q4W7_NEODS|mmetsp:Transcript_33290/g.102807  ORF Transcript_33290/g.102807 Transcript_33290/m.102807 type:complete len:243 (+) Transcript_33290:35-763(+)|eukprot:CAMPEP_0174855892 /NCGR_PEP_ID=MMETSP1114-20130205/34534_1 /TAXON_ID=312471 /ORGANISM="Neobodo designis, Strain CCAP 1951/1" /LENGTH=242 /DNA_ID=CAMNT_0016090665 /DNA_START=33 /DNA_END=761 /DNA_ORIENTATION=+
MSVGREMPAPTFKGTEIPGVQESVWVAMNMFTSLFQAGLTHSRTTFGRAAPHSALDEYDSGTQSWAGEGGLRYRVPLVDLPSELHTRSKYRNIRILLDNLRTICLTDQLPCTPEEKEFWGNYRMLKFQLFLNPFAASASTLYVTMKVLQDKIPIMVRGRAVPFLLAGVFAEQYQEANFPAQDLLQSALMARTPLGDAARAEWQRLQPATIPQSYFTMYQLRNIVRDPIPGFQFGGNLHEALA